jgi:hypothetical protein
MYHNHRPKGCGQPQTGRTRGHLRHHGVRYGYNCPLLGSRQVLPRHAQDLCGFETNLRGERQPAFDGSLADAELKAGRATDIAKALKIGGAPFIGSSDKRSPAEAVFG